MPCCAPIINYTKTREEMQELFTAKANGDRIPNMDVEQDAKREKDHERR